MRRPLMRTLTRSVIACAMLYSFASCHAQEPQKDPCDNPSNTVEMRECAWKKFKAADADLNKVYGELMSKVVAVSGKQHLKKAQNEWLKFRDANADFESSFYEGGSAKEQIRVYALLRMTQDRMKELKNTIDNEFNR
jgi:uncharacterized protein YecT (DUF1311 family)